MGTYLSTPVTDKCEESGEHLDCPEVPCSWGVVDMQGWRKSMEDSHIAVTDISLPAAPNDDGADDDGTADETKDCNHISDAKVFGVFDGHGGAEVARLCSLYMVSVLTQQPTWKEGVPNTIETGVEDAGETKVGKALRSAFHALDRMVDDLARREEIVNLRTLKPHTGERRDAIFIPEEQVVAGKAPESVTLGSSTDGGEQEITTAGVATTTTTEDPTKTEEAETPAEAPVEEIPVSDDPQPATEVREGAVGVEEDSKMNDDDSDSNEAVGKEEAADQDRDMMDDDEEGTKTASPTLEVADPSKPTKVTAMFQKILSLGTQAGQVVVKLGGDDAEDSEAKAITPTTPTGPSASRPTLIHNGRMVCNLPDHAVHAGATAIVAVITGKILTVANAGDSRAVLCRAGGQTYPMSYDHKPHDEIEMNRITKAGGFVNHFGRVNGNLNLSRSIGDLKYKQVPGIPPPEQMITSEPDIIQVALEPEDEFIILGCDGIWDCLTNENAVQYVRERIDTKSPTEIGTEMLDAIISEDPRVTQGIGGDNMTIMIIDLLPMSRKGRLGPEASSSAE